METYPFNNTIYELYIYMGPEIGWLAQLKSKNSELECSFRIIY